MKFGEAMIMLELGFKVRNKEWSETEYIYLNKETLEIHDEDDEHFEITNIGACGWEIYEEYNQTRVKWRMCADGNWHKQKNK